jgi:hypothetical protein
MAQPDAEERDSATVVLDSADSDAGVITDDTGLGSDAGGSVEPMFVNLHTQTDASTAARMCAEIGRQLPIVPSAESSGMLYAFVLTEGLGSPWIGMRWPNAFWVDGTPVEWYTWSSGNPNGQECTLLLANDPHSALSDLGTWHSRPCEDTDVFVVCQVLE